MPIKPWCTLMLLPAYLRYTLPAAHLATYHAYPHSLVWCSIPTHTLFFVFFMPNEEHIEV